MIVKVYFDLGLEALKPISGFIDWEYPILPRMGESVYSALPFLPKDIKKQFGITPALDYVPESYFDTFGEDKRFHIDDTLFDYFASYAGEGFQIMEIEWLDDGVNGTYPLLYISPSD